MLAEPHQRNRRETTGIGKLTERCAVDTRSNGEVEMHDAQDQ